MAVPDAPARALVIFGDGLMQALSPPPKHSHLHGLAASGVCGFLALRDVPPQVNRDLFELQQILDVQTMFSNEAIPQARISDFKLPSISERFMGMNAAMVTNSGPVANLGKQLGFSLLDDKINLLNEGAASVSSLDGLPDSSTTAAQLIEILGLDGACTGSDNSFELVLLHIGSRSGNDKDQVDHVYLDWINALVGEVKSLVQPGTRANDHLYLALILGYGDAAVLGDNLRMNDIPTLESPDSLSSELIALRPQQTYKMKDGELVNDVRDHHPLIVVHQMDGVTRRDHATFLSFDEIRKNGSNLTILADRFLHEIAFKLWKAPKYGA